MENYLKEMLADLPYAVTADATRRGSETRLDVTIVATGPSGPIGTILTIEGIAVAADRLERAEFDRVLETIVDTLEAMSSTAYSHIAAP